jgi:nicotinic acid mononucleotide adenylyltransferase
MFRAMRDKLMRRVGLLGGSFNPAHPGHLHISREALKRLRLDEVWWLVSPQNPLKKKTDLAPYATRLEMARKTATDPRIHVSSLEGERGLYYTIDTLRYLLRGNRDTQFFWLMGADNLAQFHRWKDWRAIAAMLPIVVLDRAPCLCRAPWSCPPTFTALPLTRRKAVSEIQYTASGLGLSHHSAPPAQCHVFTKNTWKTRISDS